MPWKYVCIVGAGFPAGDWNRGGADALVQDPANPEIYVFDGNIRNGGGEFKMYTEKSDNWSADALMPPAEHFYLEDGVPATMVLIPGANPDNKYHFPSSGNWRLEVNVNLMTATAFKK